MERPTSGRIFFQGNEITALDEKQQRAVRPQIQLVFQDPARSLNPRFSALELVSEPLLVQGRLHKRKREDRARASCAGGPAPRKSLAKGGRIQRWAKTKAGDRTG